MACSFLNKIVLPYSYHNNAGNTNNNLLGIEVSSNLINAEVSFDSGANWAIVNEGSNLNFDANNYYGDLPLSIVTALSTNTTAQSNYGDVWFRNSSAPATICKYKLFVVSRPNGNGFNGATILLQCNANNTANLIINTTVFENTDNATALGTIRLSGVPGFTNVAPTYISTGAFKTAVWNLDNVPINTGTSADTFDLVFTSSGETDLTFSYNTTGLCPIVTTTAEPTTTAIPPTTTAPGPGGPTTTSPTTPVLPTPCECHDGTISNNNAFSYYGCNGVLFSGGAESGSTICYDINAPYSSNIIDAGISAICNCGSVPTTTTTTTTTTSSTTTTTTSNITTTTSNITTTTSNITTTTSNITSTTLNNSVNITALDFNLGTATQSFLSNDINFPDVSLSNGCTYTAFQLVTLPPTGVNFLKNGVILPLNVNFTNSDEIKLQVAANTVPNSYTVTYRAVGSCGQDTAVISFSVIAGDTTTTSGGTTTTSNITTTTSSNNTSTTTSNTTNTFGNIQVSNFNIGLVSKGAVTNDIVFPTPTVSGGCNFTGLYKITSIPAYGILLKNGEYMPVNSVFNNLDVIQIASSTTDISGFYNISYSAQGSCGYSLPATLGYTIVTNNITTSNVNQPIVRPQSITTLIGTRNIINLSDSDVVCFNQITSYDIKPNSIIGLVEVNISGIEAEFDVIGSFARFIKRMYCNGIYKGEASVTIDGISNNTLPQNCVPCNETNSQPLWELFKQVGNIKYFRDINVCSPSYNASKQESNCKPDPCGCS